MIKQKEEPSNKDLELAFTRLGDQHKSLAELHYVADRDIFIIALSNSSEVLVTEIKGEDFRKQAYQSEKILENLYGE